MAAKDTPKKDKSAKKAEKKARRSQIFQAFKMQRKEDKLLIPWMLGVFLVVVGLFVLVGLLLNVVWWLAPMGVVTGLLAAMIVFGRRVQKSVYGKAEGQPGAAGWALDNLRGNWRVTQGVAVTTQFDAVHRVIGGPGVLFVAEGSPHRIKGLLAQEKKRTSRLVGDVPIYDITVGNEEGQVPLKKLQRHMMKLPRNLKGKEVDALEAKLSALSGKGGGMAQPKGPAPQNAKMRSVQRTVKRR